MTDLDMITAAVFLGTLVCVLFLAVATGDSASRRQQKRLDSVRRRWSGTAADDRPAESLVRNADESRLGSMALRLMPRRHMLRERLIKAGFKMSPGQYALISIALAGVAGVVVKTVFAASLLMAAMGAVVIGLGLPHWFCSSRIRARLAKFTRQFPEAIDLMVRGIKSGLPISETIASIGQEMPDPVGTEFQRITDSVKLGQTLEEALWDAARRIDTAEFKFFVISLSVQRETGGNLAETLENLSDVLRKRHQMQLKIKAMSSEARASAYIIGSLPFVVGGILMLMNPKYVMILFTDPRGMFILGIGLFMMALGSFVMAKMVRFDI